jgi:hypothetical protein
LVALDQSLPDITWPTDDEFNDLLVKFRHVGPDDFANLIVVVDGTEIPIRRPKDNEIKKQFYSPKKKQYSVTFLLIVHWMAGFFMFLFFLRGNSLCFKSSNWLLRSTSLTFICKQTLWDHW